MSHLTIPSKETILQHFHHFLAKAVQEDPASSDILQDFYRLHNMLLDNIPTASCISEFLTSLTQKYSQLGAPKELQTPDTSNQNIPPNIPLKYFDPSIVKNSSGLSRFTFYSYKDYLRKNSVRLPSSSTPVYTQLADFLPDSQNFYRVIGLGLIGLYLANPELTNRLRNICNKVVSEELNLSAQDYPFTSEELKITFYSYINQLIDVSNSSSDANQSQEMLFSMGAVDKAFDAAVISFVKNEIIHHLDRKIEDKNLKNRLWLAESDVVDDIISQIPDIFNIRLVVQTVENRSIKEIAYQPQCGGDFPEVHILNEKHVSYQNFALLRKETEKAQRSINTEDSSPLNQNKNVFIKDGYESKKKFIRRERSREQDGDEQFWGVESDSHFSHNDSDVSPTFDSSTRPEYKVKKRTDPTEESILEREEALQERIPMIKKTISDRITPEGSKERNFQSVKEDFSTADTKGKSSDRDFRVDVKEWAVTSNNGTRPGIKMLDEKQSAWNAKTAMPEQHVTRTLSQENTYSNQSFGVNREIGNAYRMYSVLEPKEYATPICGRELKERTNIQSVKDYMSNNQEKEQENKRRISKEEIEELRRKYGSKRS